MREPYDFVVCRECGELLRLISSFHLKLHGMTRDDYRKKHPNAPLMSEDLRDKYRKCDSARARNEVMWAILWLFGTEPEDYVTCRECGRRFQCIQWGHLKKHGMTTREYKEKHPGVWIVSLRYRKSRSVAIQKGFRLGRLKSWNKGLAKETDPRIAQHGKTLSEKYASGELVQWSKGQTKETHPKLVLAAEKRIKTLREGFRTGRYKNWSKGLTKETDPRLAKASLSHIEELKRRWKRYEELGTRIGAERPNKEEKILGGYLSVFGYVYNRKVLCSGFSNIIGRERRLIPDFVSERFPDRPVEYLGWLGHSPKSPYNKGSDIMALDNERDQLFSQNGYTNINIYPEDLQKGREYIVNMMEEKLCQSINM